MMLPLGPVPQPVKNADHFPAPPPATTIRISSGSANPSSVTSWIRARRSVFVYLSRASVSACSGDTARSTSTPPATIDSPRPILAPRSTAAREVWSGTTCGPLNPNYPTLIVTNSNVTVSHSLIEGGFAGVGNIDGEAHFTGFGTTYPDMSVASSSPCVDAGNPAAIYEDVVFPPSLGGSRNDMGMNGGPLAAGWLGWSGW